MDEFPKPGKGQKQGKPGESESKSQSQGSQSGSSGGGSKGTDTDTLKRLTRGGPQSPWSRLRDKDRDPERRRDDEPQNPLGFGNMPGMPPGGAPGGFDVSQLGQMFTQLGQMLIATKFAIANPAHAASGQLRRSKPITRMADGLDRCVGSELLA